VDRWSAGSGELERLLDIVTVNVLVGNADAHAKNFSLLHDTGGQVRLAPAYDLMATIHYANVSTIPGMFVNGVRDIAQITRDDLIAEATSWGIAGDVAADRIGQLLRAAEGAIDRAATEVRPPDELVDAVTARVQALAP